MENICEFATLTSKGQITFPKSIRQALGVGAGQKLAFIFDGKSVRVTRAEMDHNDPAITGFLHMLENDVRSGRNVREIPESLLNAMIKATFIAQDEDEPIEGEVAL